MKFLNDLRIKSKLRIPIIFLLFLLTAFFYFFLCTDSLIKSELEKKIFITDACKKIRTIYCSIIEYLNQKKSYNQLNSDYQALLQLVEEEELIGDKEKEEIIKLDDVFRRVDIIFKENTRLEKQVLALTDDYLQQFNTLNQKEGDLLPGVRPEIVKSIYHLNWNVINLDELFLKANQQMDYSTELMESLDQTAEAIESEGLRLANTEFASLVPNAKDKVAKAKGLAVRVTENSKIFYQANEAIMNTYNGLLEHVHQRETRNTNAIVAAIKNTFYAMGTVIFVITLLIIVLYHALSKFITVPLRSIIDHTYELAGNRMDITRRLEVDSRDEIGEISGWINTFLERLQRFIKHAKHIAGEVSIATKILTAGSEGMASRTHEQAKSSSDIAAGFEKIKEAFRLTKENSIEANIMLADFYKEIQVKSSLVDHVEATGPVKQLPEFFGQMDGVVREIEQKIAYITMVSQEQSTNIRQITKAIGRLKQVSTQNTSLAVQLLDANQRVRDNAFKLQNLLVQFKIDDSPAPQTDKIENINRQLSVIDANAKPPFPSPGRKKRNTRRKSETVLISEETTINTSTEDDFFGTTNDTESEEK